MMEQPWEMDSEFRSGLRAYYGTTIILYTCAVILIALMTDGGVTLGMSVFMFLVIFFFLPLAFIPSNVAKECKKARMNPWVWGTLSAVVPLIGVAIFLVAIYTRRRNREFNVYIEPPPQRTENRYEEIDLNAFRKMNARINDAADDDFWDPDPETQMAKARAFLAEFDEHGQIRE